MLNEMEILVSNDRWSIGTEDLIPGNGLPSVFRAVDSIDLQKWIFSNRDWVERQLLASGGILFRGFNIDTVDKFDTLMALFNEGPSNYIFRSSPRGSLTGKVYESTVHPRDRNINLHSEQSYSYARIQKIAFCCISPATFRGETPIADNRKILGRLDEKLRNKFLEMGVLYRRRISRHFGMPWQEVFQTNDIEKVKEECFLNHIDLSIEDGDSLSLSWKKDAIVRHPLSNEFIWFNHVFFFNKFSLYEELSMDADDDLPDELIPYNTYFGDGSAISYQEYENIRSAYDSERIMFDWKKGDVLLLDNMLASHGRSPFEGERKIVVSMI